MSKHKCDLVRKIGEMATWLRNSIDPMPKDIGKLNQFFEMIEKHTVSKCACLPKPAINIWIGISRLEEFNTMIRNLIPNVHRLEFELKSWKAKSEKDADGNKKRFNDIYQANKSRFEFDYNLHFNQTNFNFLQTPLIKSLVAFEKALEDDKCCDSKKRVLNENIVLSHQVLDHLNTLYIIFNFYDLECLAMRASALAMKYLQNYISISKSFDVWQISNSTKFESIVITYCNFIKQFLDFGQISTARNLFEKFFKGFDFPDLIGKKLTTTYSISIAFLLYCELLYRERKWQVVAPMLKNFATSDYITRGTVKSHVLKMMTYGIITRFPPCIYEYTPYYAEFAEPMQIFVSVCRRWGLFGINSEIPKNLVLQERLWFQFTVFSLINSQMSTLCWFYVSSGLVSDASFYHFYGHYINLVTLNIMGYAKLQLLAATLDQQCGFYECAETKLQTILRLLRERSSEANFLLFENGFEQVGDLSNSIPSSHSSSENVSLLGTSEQIDTVAAREEVESEQKNDAYQMYRSLQDLHRKLENGDDFEDLHTGKGKLKLYELNDRKLVQAIMREMDKITLTPKLYKSIFPLLLHCFALKLSIERCKMHSSDKNFARAGITPSRYHLFLNIVEKYLTIECNPAIELYSELFYEWKECFAKISVKQQLFPLLGGSLFWYLSNQLVYGLTEVGKFKEAICFIEKLTMFPSFAFYDRLNRSYMFYYRGVSLIGLLRKEEPYKTKFNSLEILTLISGELQTFTDICDNQQVKTPPKMIRRQQQKSKLVAPTKKTLPSPMKEYADTLLASASKTRETAETRRLVSRLNFDESPEHHDADTLLDNRKKIKNIESTDNHEMSDKLNFEINQLAEELGGLSINVKNLLPNTTEKYQQTFDGIFDIQNDLETFDISKLNPQDVLQCLNKVITYISNTPPTLFYSAVQQLLFNYYRLIGEHNMTRLCYHLTESIPSVSLRYRSQFNAHRRFSSKPPKSYSMKIENLSFKNDLFIYKDYLTDFPEDWRFVHIKIMPTSSSKVPSLMVVRYQKKMSPLCFTIEANKEKTLKFFMEEFEILMKENHSSLIETDKEAYWKLRFSIDDRLRLLLKDVEEKYFGFLRGILLGSIGKTEFVNRCARFKFKIKNFVNEAKINCVNWNLFSVVVESMPFLKPEDINACIKNLFETENPKFVKFFNETRDYYFKFWYDAKNLKVLYDQASPVGLILDPVLAQFPVESMPTVREFQQPLFRVPSLHFAQVLYQTHRAKLTDDGLDHDASTYYVVNPANNLETTQSYFEPLFRSIEHWQGTLGTEPNPIELEESLEKRKLYLFFGHGSGSVYYRSLPNTLDCVNIDSSAIVMGCSSGRNIVEAQGMEVFGMPYRFMLNGAPCYVGALWDVTDKDIDKYSDQLLALWCKAWPTKSEVSREREKSLAKAVAMARNVCKLKHLIGSAPVVYGLPMINKQA